MELYKKRSFLNVLLILLGLVILLVTIFYANFLAQSLKEREYKNTYIYAQSVRDLNEFAESSDQNALNQDIGVKDTIINAFELPIILEDEMGYLTGNNWGLENDTSTVFLQKKKAEFLAKGFKPIEGFGYAKNIYYFNSKLLDYIKIFPYLVILLISSFILLGYIFFSTSKKAEQNRVWAGMAKETAHQLGTPISAIIAWIEHLRETKLNVDQADILSELRNDVNRLELVADRFSKIGSEPVLTKVNIYNEMDKCKIYMQRRAPRHVKFVFPPPEEREAFVSINRHLFDWVIENLIRNALDAMDAHGEISATIHTDESFVTIDLSDTGKGIPSGKLKTVFQPGFTTKKRGWGLGLSLAKRIIEEYHKGKIFVKQSKIGEGTTFTIKLPRTI